MWTNRKRRKEAFSDERSRIKRNRGAFIILLEEEKIKPSKELCFCLTFSHWCLVSMSGAEQIFPSEALSCFDRTDDRAHCLLLAVPLFDPLTWVWLPFELSRNIVPVSIACDRQQENKELQE